MPDYSVADRMASDATTDEPGLRAALEQTREALDGATDVAEHFIRKYGLANTSGEKHAVRKAARNAALNVIELARAALATPAASVRHDAESPVGSLDVAWREAESALPDGWRIMALLDGEYDGDNKPARVQWFAQATNEPYYDSLGPGGVEPKAEGRGDTPAAALRELAVRLTELEQE